MSWYAQNAQDVFISGLTIDGQTTASKGIVCFDSKVEISNAKIIEQKIKKIKPTIEVEKKKIKTQEEKYPGMDNIFVDQKSNKKKEFIN